MEQEGDTYCGFLCDDIIERQQEIINDIKDFAEYNQSFAMVMIGRLTEMLINGGGEIPHIKPHIP